MRYKNCWEKYKYLAQVQQSDSPAGRENQVRNSTGDSCDMDGVDFSSAMQLSMDYRATITLSFILLPMETILDTELYPLIHIPGFRLQCTLNYENNFHMAVSKDYFVGINAEMSFEKEC